MNLPENFILLVWSLSYEYFLYLCYQDFCVDFLLIVDTWFQL